MTPGFYKMPAEEYHADPCPDASLSSSIAKVLLDESPRKAWHSHPKLNKDFKDEHDEKFDIGTAAHAMLLEDDRSRIVVVQADDWRTKAAKEQREAARAAGKTALLERHFDATLAMVVAAREFVAKSEVSELWKNSESELTGIVRDGTVWLRARFDRITRDRRIILDYKSTENASPEKFSILLVRLGYHIQEAFYRRVATLLGVSAPQFVFLAQSVEAPHECSLHGCDPALQEIADAEVLRAIALWRQCLAKDSWPSYGGRVHWAMPTTWMMQRHEERLQEAA